MFLTRVKAPSLLLDRFLTWLSPGTKEPQNLVEVTEEARLAWHQAQRELDFINGDMTDHVIFKINAAERRYVALLLQARSEAVMAWTPKAEVGGWKLEVGSWEKNQVSQRELSP